jgi:tol-pal system protein YbgF
MTRPVGVLAILLVVAGGCAARGSVRENQEDLQELRAELNTLRDAHDQHARDTTRALDQLRALDDRLRALGTVVADTGETVRRLNERLTVLDTRTREARVEPAPRPAAPAPVAPQPAPGPPRESAPRESLARENPARETPARETAQRADGGESAYQAALTTFRSREYGQAVLEFLDFLSSYPKHPLAGKAQYWIGEAYYIQRDWRQALVEYEKVPALDGRSGTMPEALLKIGLCYQNLREPVRAQQSWRRVVADYPDSDAAQKARGFLRGSGASR